MRSPQLRHSFDQPPLSQGVSSQTQASTFPARPLLSQSQPCRNSMPAIPTRSPGQSAQHEDLERTIRSPRRKPHDQPTAAEIASAWQQSNRQTSGSSNSSSSTTSNSVSSQSDASSLRPKPPLPTVPHTADCGLDPAAQLGHVPVHTGFAVKAETPSPVEETPRILTSRRSNSTVSMDSVDSTESSDTKRSFVARMKQRYQDESARSSYFDGTVSHGLSEEALRSGT